MSARNTTSLAILLCTAFTAVAVAQTSSKDYPQWRGQNRDGFAAAFGEPRSLPEHFALKGLDGVVVGLADEPRLDLDTDAAGAELLRGRNRNAAVAGSEIVDDVGRRDVRHLQHRLDDVLRRRDVANVRLLFRPLLRGQRCDQQRGGGHRDPRRHGSPNTNNE